MSIKKAKALFLIGFLAWFPYMVAVTLLLVPWATGSTVRSVIVTALIMGPLAVLGFLYYRWGRRHGSRVSSLRLAGILKRHNAFGVENARPVDRLDLPAELLSLVMTQKQRTVDSLAQDGINVTSDCGLYLSGVPCETCGRTSPPGSPFCVKCGAALSGQVQPPISSVLPDEFPGFWLRFAACGVDVFTLWVLGYVAIQLKVARLSDPFLFLWPAAPLYYWLMTGLGGQTLGKRLLQIKVVNAQRDAPGLVKAFLREIVGKFVSAIILGMGFASIAEDSQRQGWHDKIAGTYVVDLRPVPEAAPASAPPASVPGLLWRVYFVEAHSWWLILLGPVGSILGLVLSWNKDRRRAWAIFCGGLFMSYVYFAAFLLLLIALSGGR